MERQGSEIILSFDHVGGGLDRYYQQPDFVAGADQQFQHAEKILNQHQIRVWADGAASWPFAHGRTVGGNRPKQGGLPPSAL